MRRPFADKLLLIGAWCLLGVTRLAIVTLSFRRLERYLGARMLESDRELPDESISYVRRVRWAIQAAAPLTPWKSNCFPQALTAKILLRRRSISSTLYLGAAFKADNKGLHGHAWVRCGPYYITGGDSESQFGAIASFAD